MILAFDAGTSSVKAVVASQSSQGGWVVHAYACSAHDPPDARGTGCEAEQNPHLWWEALVRAVHMVSEQTDLDVVEAISLSGQMQSVILVDAAGAAVRTTLTLILTYGCGFARTMVPSPSQSHWRTVAPWYPEPYPRDGAVGAVPSSYNLT